MTSGHGWGGARPGGGRPVGAVSLKARELIAEAKDKHLPLPVDYLLSVMRDPKAPQRDRMWCAGQAAPFCHAKLNAIRVVADTNHIDDLALVTQLRALEQIADATPEMSEPQRAAQLEERQLEERQLNLFNDVRGLRPHSQDRFFVKLIDMIEVEMKRLAETDRPGAVVPRRNGGQLGRPG